VLGQLTANNSPGTDLKGSGQGAPRPGIPSTEGHPSPNRSFIGLFKDEEPGNGTAEPFLYKSTIGNNDTRDTFL